MRRYIRGAEYSDVLTLVFNSVVCRIKAFLFLLLLRGIGLRRNIGEKRGVIVSPQNYPVVCIDDWHRSI